MSPRAHQSLLQQLTRRTQPRTPSTCSLPGPQRKASSPIAFCRPVRRLIWRQTPSQILSIQWIRSSRVVNDTRLLEILSMEPDSNRNFTQALRVLACLGERHEICTLNLMASMHPSGQSHGTAYSTSMRIRFILNLSTFEYSRWSKAPQTH